MIDLRIDYIQFSAKQKVISAIKDFDSHMARSNIRFYERMTTYTNGIRAYTGNPNTDRTLFVFDGKTCDRLNVTPETCKFIVKKWEGSVTRLDLAMTIDKNILGLIMRDKDKIVSGLWNEVKAFVDSEMNIETIYVRGKAGRGKVGIVRCYDKALESGAGGVLDRIEIEMRRKHADIGAKRLAHGDSVQAVMNSKFRIEAKWYRDIFGEDIATTRMALVETLENDEITRKMTWLMKQIAPSIAYVMKYDLDNGTKNHDLLQRKIESEYRKLIKLS